MKRLLRVVTMLAIISLGLLTAAGCGGHVEASTLRPDGQVVNVSLVSFAITPDVTRIPAGAITFKATNTDVVTHEMLVVKAQGEGFELPYDFAISRVFEDKIDKPGEIPDIKGGTSGEVTLTLEPGTYLLMCNLTAHFQAGMHTRITVVR